MVVITETLKVITIGMILLGIRTGMFLSTGGKKLANNAFTASRAMARENP